MALSLPWLRKLGPSWDVVRTDLRTLRLAIASGDRRDRATHRSQVAKGHHPPPLRE